MSYSRVIQAAVCWEQAGLTHVLQQRMQHFSSVIEVIMDICSVEEKSVAGHVAMVMWVVWNSRNNWLWNGQKRFATQLGEQATIMLLHTTYKPETTSIVSVIFAMDCVSSQPNSGFILGALFFLCVYSKQNYYPVLFSGFIPPQ
jgi:hypothetical protein